MFMPGGELSQVDLHPRTKLQIVLMGHIQGQPNLTTKQKARIAGMVEARMSHGRVARIVGSGQTKVSSTVSWARTHGTVKTTVNSGQPLWNSKQDLMQLQRSLASHPKSTLAEVTNTMATLVSSSTVQQRAHNIGNGGPATLTVALA
ncbi:uncharacterized protein PGTG_21818 [Puccinia graminis f. sp. tritici CRL 75-36-700-3]|uniref:Uncharacterized protein n=1 Tax=Puccinia graminis f. sp. tritici (strain CRL 75-36-700-3 / race SCCL) TaxID=418459 RepID=H6QSR1_PUCGT|nr:uncharacterized protein PGTG_21818 [Puccinia graminis f. sp. tritici CRL 75-36-700-3]EHS63801.1 hypothetical protein PGTG_21818 [Puccinia graminis f. sp. tritici CRL 75-36-700-3]